MDGSWVYAMTALGWFLGSIVSGAVGVGAAMTAMPLLLLVLAPNDVVLVSSMVGVPLSIHLMWAYRASCCWNDMKWLILGCIPGTMLGALTLKVISLQALQILMGGMLIAFIIFQLFLRQTLMRKEANILPDTVPVKLLAGGVCGFACGSVAIPGAPLGIYVLLKGWNADRSRGNMSIFHPMALIWSVASQATAGLYTVEIFKMASCCIVTCLIGQTLGFYLGRFIDQKLFQRIILLFLAASALALLWRSI